MRHALQAAKGLDGKGFEVSIPQNRGGMDYEE
jgi:hypothetical protein